MSVTDNRKSHYGVTGSPHSGNPVFAISLVASDTAGDTAGITVSAIDAIIGAGSRYHRAHRAEQPLPARRHGRERPAGQRR
jgi:hypothetical protein